MRIPAVLLLLLFVSGSPCRAGDDALVKELAQHRASFRFEDGKLEESAAAKLLLDEARQSQFFLIAEDHGSAETPHLAAALYEAFQPLGYTHIAIEAGPLTGERLEAMAAKGGLEAVGAFSRAHSFTLPFFNWKEESEYLVAAVHSKKPGVKRAVWGVDQEFILSPAFHLARLEELAANDAARALVHRAKERSDAGDAEMAAKKNPSAVLFAHMTPAEFDELGAVFGKNAEAARIVSELRESAEIYQLFFKGEGYRSNHERAEMIKRHFATYYAEAVTAGERRPRVLLKFGANHMMRGRTFADVFDLGTFLPELAAENGLRAFQLLVVAPGGHVNRLTPFSASADDRNAAYDPKHSRNLFFDPTPFLAAAEPDGWTLIDLRPLRPLLSGGKLVPDEPLRRVIWGYDAVLVAPEFHAATLFE